MELNKVLGEENPADLLTKHSLSKERVEKLVSLYDCHFKGGRAETAPMTRSAASAKKTIAQADASTRGIQKVEEHTGASLLPDVKVTEPVSVTHEPEDHQPRMPHNEMDHDHLNLQYPSSRP